MRGNEEANIGGPNGSLSPRSVAHTCHVFPYSIPFRLAAEVLPSNNTH
jgi:hypothetical protein